MKKITNVEVRNPYRPLEENKDGVLCKCYWALVFNKSDRLPYETVEIHCPVCGNIIIFG